jgi:hypothetical protein
VTQDLAKQVQRCKLKQWVHFTTAKEKFCNTTIPPTLSSTNLEFHQLFEQDHESHQQQALADVSSSLVQKHPQKSLCPKGASFFAANGKKNHSHQLSGSSLFTTSQQDTEACLQTLKSMKAFHIQLRDANSTPHSKLQKLLLLDFCLQHLQHLTWL